MRNPNGHGTVTKLSGNRCKSFVARVTENKIRKTIGTYETYEQASQALKEYRQTPEMTYTIETLFKLYDKNILATKAKGTRANILCAYNQLANAHNIPIEDFTYLQAQKLIDNMTSKAVQENAKKLIKSLLDYSQIFGISTNNFAGFLQVNKESEKQAKVIFSKEEIKDLWENKSDNIITQLLILIYSGMRAGELYAVKDVKLSDRYLISGIKTEAGKNRVIPLREEIIPLIETNISKYNNIAGKYALNSLISYIPKATDNHSSHDCRHTFISLLSGFDVSIVTINKIIGHSTGILSIDTYTKKNISELLNAVNKLK